MDMLGMPSAIATREGLSDTHLSVSRQVDLESFAVVLEPKRGHCEEDVFAVNRFPLLLLTLL